MRSKTGRYSILIRPVTYSIDILMVNLFAFLILPDLLLSLYFSVFISLSWIIIALNIDFYDVYRYTKLVTIYNKIFKQFSLFTIVCYAFAGFYVKNIDPKLILQYTLLCITTIAFFKIGMFLALKKYRTLVGGNLRKVIIVGDDQNAIDLSNFFNENPDYGYKLENIFAFDNNKTQNYFQFVQDHKVDEIYCSLKNLTEEQINSFIDFTDNNLKVLKFIPDESSFFTKNLKVDYYGVLPIASLRDIPLDDDVNIFIKRVFDILFSVLVVVFFLSWLIPILGILIKLESKGPVFFKQKRNGLNYKEFNCFKFRSMNLNEIADLEQVQKNDPRITKIGRIIRKTSIDELPQFFNVILGEMSVVGPRPHMVSHTEMYAERVDKFMVRHFVKPGITGLAQTNGFRGEVENEKDIIYRVKYDIFYLENWSLLLDLKIIGMTIYNAIKGDKKAY